MTCLPFRFYRQIIITPPSVANIYTTVLYQAELPMPKELLPTSSLHYSTAFVCVIAKLYPPYLFLRTRLHGGCTVVVIVCGIINVESTVHHIGIDYGTSFGRVVSASCSWGLDPQSWRDGRETSAIRGPKPTNPL